MKVTVELLQDNRLIGSHVFRKGDVVEMDQERAKAWIKAGHAAVTNKTPTPIPAPTPRFPKNDFPVTRTASNPEAAAALKEAEERNRPRGKSKVA